MSNNYDVTEQAIKAERFVRKYKKLLIFIIVIIVLALVGIKINNYLIENKAEQASALYFSALRGDDKATQELQEKNPNLYAALMLQQNKLILESANLDPLLKDLAQIKDGKNTLFLKDLATVKTAYEALKNNDFKKAHSLAASVSESSPFYTLAKAIIHYKVEE